MNKFDELKTELVECSIELAAKIRNAMTAAEITEIGDYSIRTITSSGFSDTSLYILSEFNIEKIPEYRSLEHRKSNYFCNDLNAWIPVANIRDRLKFVNDARSIIEEIDAIKQKVITHVEDALKAVENL